VLIKIASTWEGINAAEPTTEGRGQMQFDLAVFAAASCALRGGEGAINITIRRPNL
jgi:transaldolase